ncbi:hypothetical protein GE061_009460 [Apolygus lucorum]|uniref:G-protein coupled receptors family 3 profile domain-containing protein n=1 Tax=Apolygus lucorum TaxID=248454 RepID=A0A8S9Y0K7_APOLU|nr:hypothetical protein GE061_009460 [Apolygus lucorum]
MMNSSFNTINKTLPKVTKQEAATGGSTSLTELDEMGQEDLKYLKCMKETLTAMLAATKKQPNISQIVKDGLNTMEEMCDALVTQEKRRTSVQKRLKAEVDKLTKWSPSKERSHGSRKRRKEDETDLSNSEEDCMETETSSHVVSDSDTAGVPFEKVKSRKGRQDLAKEAQRKAAREARRDADRIRRIKQQAEVEAQKKEAEKKRKESEEKRRAEQDGRRKRKEAVKRDMQRNLKRSQALVIKVSDQISYAESIIGGSIGAEGVMRNGGVGLLSTLVLLFLSGEEVTRVASLPSSFRFEEGQALDQQSDDQGNFAGGRRGGYPHLRGDDCRGEELSSLVLDETKFDSRVLDSATALVSSTTDLNDNFQASEWIFQSDPEPLSVLLSLPSYQVRVDYRSKGEIDASTRQLYVNTIQKLNASSATSIWTYPFYDCNLDSWVFGYITRLPVSKGVIGLFYSLDRVDLDQCDEDMIPIFPGAPRCDPLSTKCIPLSGFGTRRGGFKCACLPGHTPVNLSRDDFLFGDWSNSYLNDIQYSRCVPNCAYESGCLAEPHFALKTAVICIQILAMLCTIVCGIVIFKRRKCKPVAAGMWTILETLLLGILILYASMVPLSFEPSMETCILMRWIRELGFIICYGAIILKLYRILMEFRTRKAHRWVVKDKDLLKYLCGMVAVMFAYLAAWTATNINFAEEGFSIVAVGVTDSGEFFQICKPLWWDYITQAGEVVFLLFGLHLGLAARNATLQYLELRYLLGAVSVEALVSSCYYMTQATMWSSLHPNMAYLVAFIRCHSTSTIVLLLIFTPIILYKGKPVRDSRHPLTHEPSDACKPVDGQYLPELDVAEVNLAEMNPEEIRAELKRLYTQLEVLRNKSICHNNPHISKRRGGRKVAHRRFSLQKKGSREKALQQQKQKQAAKQQNSDTTEANEQEVSRTPEDSVCSVEGPSAIYNDGPSTYSELCGTPHRNSKQ